MAKEIILYYGLHNWTAEALINEIGANMGKKLTMRVNSPGGDVFASWGVFAKMIEHGNITVKVDGYAASGAFNLMFYAKEVECLDVSRFMCHRADGYAETPEQKQLLNSINADLRKKMESKIDTGKFKAVTGHTIEDLFNPETRLNIWLTAKQMKELGVVNKVNKLEPSEIMAIAADMSGLGFDVLAAVPPVPIESEKPESKNTDMTIEKLKAEFPLVYAAIMTEGAKQEKVRVSAWMAFQKIDADAVAKGIADGTEVNAAVIAQMTVKALSAENLKALGKDSPAGVEVEDPAKVQAAKTEKEKEEASFIMKVNASLGRKVAEVKG